MVTYRYNFSPSTLLHPRICCQGYHVMGKAKTAVVVFSINAGELVTDSRHDAAVQAEDVQRVDAGQLLLPHLHRLQHHRGHPDAHLPVGPERYQRGICGGIQRQRARQVNKNC